MTKVLDIKAICNPLSVHQKHITHFSEFRESNITIFHNYSNYHKCTVYTYFFGSTIVSGKKNKTHSSGLNSIMNANWSRSTRVLFLYNLNYYPYPVSSHSRHILIT